MLRKIIMTLAVVFIAAFTIGFVSYHLLAHKYREVEEVYTVRPNDTLWGICTHYRTKDARDLYILDYKSEVESDNPFLKRQGGMVYVGDKLLIKYKVED